MAKEVLDVQHGLLRHAIKLLLLISLLLIVVVFSLDFLQDKKTREFLSVALSEVRAQVESSIVQFVQHSSEEVLEEGLNVRHSLATSIEAGFLPFPVESFERTMLALFATSHGFMAIYSAMSDGTTFKFHRENLGDLRTQVRICNETFQGWYERIRPEFDWKAANFTQTEIVAKQYSPFTQGWYIAGNATSAAGKTGYIFTGPNFQSSRAQGEERDMPVYELWFRVDWPQNPYGGSEPFWSVFKLKFAISALNAAVASMDPGSHGGIALVNEKGLVAGIADEASQVVKEANGKPSVAEVWNVDLPAFSTLRPEMFNTTLQTRYRDGTRTVQVAPLEQRHSPLEVVVVTDDRDFLKTSVPVYDSSQKLLAVSLSLTVMCLLAWLLLLYLLKIQHNNMLTTVRLTFKKEVDKLKESIVNLSNALEAADAMRRGQEQMLEFIKLCRPGANQPAPLVGFHAALMFDETQQPQDQGKIENPSLAGSKRDGGEGKLAVETAPALGDATALAAKTNIADVDLDQVLHHPGALEIFKDFAFNRHSEEGVMFLCNLESYKRAAKSRTLPKEMLNAQGQALLAAFVQPGSPYQLNVSSRLLQNYRSKVGSSVTPKSFDELFKTVRAMVTDELWPAFQRSEAYPLAVRSLATDLTALQLKYREQYNALARSKASPPSSPQHSRLNSTGDISRVNSLGDVNSQLDSVIAVVDVSTIDLQVDPASP